MKFHAAQPRIAAPKPFKEHRYDQVSADRRRRGLDPGCLRRQRFEERRRDVELSVVYPACVFFQPVDPAVFGQHFESVVRAVGRAFGGPGFARREEGREEVGFF